jgi:hypothetical protein
VLQKLMGYMVFIASLFGAASKAEREAFLHVHCISKDFLQHNQLEGLMRKMC